MGIYIKGEGILRELNETAFDAEDALQALIAVHPGLLDGKQQTPDNPRRWVLVRREMPIHDLALDLLLVDQDAVPTLVEVKRGENPETKRKVIGQMLEYAAHAPLYWTTDQLRESFNGNCDDPDGALQALLKGEARAEEDLDENEVTEFWHKVATNLAAKRMRLLFVADKLPDELKRVVEFLNETTMEGIDVLAVELKQFMNGPTQTLVSQVMGQRAKPHSRRGNRKPLEGTPYGDGLKLERSAPGTVKQNLHIDQLFIGDKTPENTEMLQRFFHDLKQRGRVTVGELKQMLNNYRQEHGDKNVKLILRRLNWFSKGDYNKDNWHLFLQSVGEEPSPEDGVEFRQIERRRDEEEE